jgi:hypothetical protein
MNNTSHYAEMELMFFLGLCIPGGFDALSNPLENNEKYYTIFDFSAEVIGLVQEIESLMSLHKEWENGEFFEDMMVAGPWMLTYVKEHKALPTAEQFRGFIRCVLADLYRSGKNEEEEEKDKYEDELIQI